ncbi:hypothetical protein [Demequina sediminicola]|uniref:hypothetical protein n=1 Tax=Demequina sediminicola TaxID=1095026 RepID=UPI000AC01820|nr:hypothetical protein [Demequina sediminicola]
MGEWSAQDTDDGDFERFFKKLPEYEQAVLEAAVTHVLERLGIDICTTEWGKSLGGGLYEFRVRRSLTAILRAYGTSDSFITVDAGRQVLLRVFCTFYGAKVILLLGGYDKRRDASSKRQQREIQRARKRLARWRSRPIAEH